MLIRFSLENWMSFGNNVTFTMVAGKERQHNERVPKIEKYNIKVLPIAAIYGGNASGKTNFFRAISFVKSLVVNGTQPDGLIPVETFLLNVKGKELPARFNFELLIGDLIYEYSFAVTSKLVLEEKLVLIKGNSETILYNRLDDKPNFDESLEDDQFLKFAFQGTRENQLFLTNSVSQKVDNFKPIYNWFKDTLELVAPDTRFGLFEQFLDESHPLYMTMNELLPKLDTGISHLGGEDIHFDNISLPEVLKLKLQEKIKEGMTVRVNAPNKEQLVVTRKNGELLVKKLVTYHSKADGTEVKFDIRQESDGSQRVIDLLPAFLELSSPLSKKVFIIDEVDRSLHTLLTKKLLELYLGNCSATTRHQLLFTTHDVLLMDQKLLRRDEMWIAERDSSGSSDLISFSEYKDIRFDKDIRKSYLQGRFGGVPRIREEILICKNEYQGGHD
ncbi:AAA family ATPase [Legionella bononiensis]|uniref:ATP-binding protein n=1 Tax=Legionella bononiensis TaxID=2793102 RepID=A0ABS1WDX1_9GAMM|nr:ATP-binding protein [Legionella bononiensis]MBL7479570.1 ATP-binding protein [Legionella bononiensis]MBL7527555.1 ATP-binding protein [Legionella bononiensis]